MTKKRTSKVETKKPADGPTSRDVAHLLALSFACVCLSRMIELGWSQERLARETNISGESVRAMLAGYNLAFCIDEYGSLLHSLGVNATLVARTIGCASPQKTKAGKP